MKKILYILMAAMAYLLPAKAQFTDTTLVLYIAHHETIFTGAFPYGGAYVMPVFTDTNINNILNNYTFTAFEWKNTHSVYPDMQQFYNVKCNNNLHLAEQLHTAFPDTFLDYYFEFSAVTLSAANSVNGANRLKVQAYPNPAGDLVHLQFPFGQDVAITLVDITGKTVAQQNFKNTSTAYFDVKQYLPGLYFYTVTQKSQTFTGQITIRH